jgi:hypothetical protein
MSKCPEDIVRTRSFSFITLVTISEILLKVALNTINQPTKHSCFMKGYLILYTNFFSGLKNVFIPCVMEKIAKIDNSDQVEK